MIIQYTYRILRVDEQAKTMEVKYDSPQFGVLHVFTRMPNKGEPLENVIRQYAPIEYWKEQIAEVDSVEVDTYGAINYSTEPSIEDITQAVRRARDQLLLASDFTQLPDAPPSINKIAWQTYRQLLREIPDQSGFPTNVVWPEMPSFHS
jgi:hypothetical protein